MASTRALPLLPLAVVTLLAAAGTTSAQARLLTLDEALQVAKTRQPQLQAARAQVAAASARLTEARSGYLPRLDAATQYQRSTTNFTITPSLASSPFARMIVIDNHLGPGDTVNYLTLGATASETVYDFGKTGGAVAQARGGVRASQSDLETTTESVALGVRVAYFGVLAAKELVRVADEQMRNQQKHLTQITQFVSAGVRPKIDRSTAALGLANAELALVRTRNGLRLTKVQLAAAMGVETLGDFDVAVPPAAAPPEEGQPTEGLLGEALGRRPEMARLLAQEASQRGLADVARAGYFPVIGALANLSSAKVEGFDIGTNWFVGLGFTWNLYAGQLTTGQVRESEANLQAIAAQRDLLRQAIRTDIEAQQLAVAEAKERLGVAERAVTTANERLALAEGRYQAGAGDILELDDAQVTQADAQAQRVQAIYDLATARARLVHAAGRSE